MKQRFSLSLLSLAVAGGLLAGCGSDDSSTNQDDTAGAPETIVLESVTASAEGVKSFDFTWSEEGAAEDSSYEVCLYVDNPEVDNCAEVLATANEPAAASVKVPSLLMGDEYFVRRLNDDGDTVSTSNSLAPEAVDLNAAVGFFKAVNAEGALSAISGDQADQFGSSVSIATMEDGTTVMAVGAIGEDDKSFDAAALPTVLNSASDTDDYAIMEHEGQSGAVYLYVERDGVWQYHSYLKPYSYITTTGSGGDQRLPMFGYSVSLAESGTLVVGAPAHMGYGSGVNSYGAVHIFQPNAAQDGWYQQAAYSVKPRFAEEGASLDTETGLDDEIAQGEDFGYSTAISTDGNTIAVGAKDWSKAAGVYQGGVFILQKDASGPSWTRTTHIAEDGSSEAYNSHGSDVALSDDGSVLLVSNVEHDFANNDGTVDGEVLLYHAAGADWATAFPNGTAEYDDPDHIFTSQSDKSLENEMFGSQVEISGNGKTVAIAAKNNSEADEAAGAVYVFTQQSDNITDWKQTRLEAEAPAANAQFGSGIALSQDGSILAVGASGEAASVFGIDANPADVAGDGADGGVYIFTNEGEEWPLKQYATAPVESYTGNVLGFSSLAVTNDGTVAVPALDDSGLEPADTDDDVTSKTVSPVSGKLGNTDEVDSGAIFLF